jgi:mannose-1-phosphate guanylyltransferase
MGRYFHRRGGGDVSNSRSRIMMNGHLWSLILAGGEGERTRLFIQRWLGSHKPKQYCSFVGTRSVFQHTVDRADQLAMAERRVIVIAHSHKHEAQAQLAGRRSGKLVVQPYNCGTAAGIFLPLTYVCASDTNATVAIYPSDHFVFPEETFVKAVADAVDCLERIPGKLILLGAVPGGAESDYGWILPGQDYGRFPSRPIRTVKSFLEKPDLEISRLVKAAGAFWSTLIMVARVDLLWKLGWYLLPEMMTQFEWIRKAIGTSRESEVIKDAYQEMPVLDFSTHVLQRVPRELAVMELSGVYWSDWGRPERIQETLESIGKRPLFPAEALLAS